MLVSGRVLVSARNAAVLDFFNVVSCRVGAVGAVTMEHGAKFDEFLPSVKV